MKQTTKIKLKRMRFVLLKALASFAPACLLFFGTVRINFLLITNWISRADVLEMAVPYRLQHPALRDDWLKLISDYQEILVSSAYARFLTSPHLLVTILILMAEIAIILGLVWMTKENFKNALRILFE